VDQAAQALLCSPPKISRIETASRAASVRDVRDLCGIYHATASECDQLMTLARQAKEQGWWQQFSDIAIESLIGFEIGATRISSYESCLVPWAFQTEAYARSVIKGILPQITQSVLDQRVAARMKRQELLTSESPPYFWSLIDESALYRIVGTQDVMRMQLTRLVEASELPNVTIQVVPYEAGAHPGINNTFSLIEFGSDPLQPPVPYIDNDIMGGIVFLDRPADIDRFREALEHLRAAALSPSRSIALIESLSQS
jgi:Domain of unknown function (DUF5753)/Helix-turn-helix domain